MSDASLSPINMRALKSGSFPVSHIHSSKKYLWAGYVPRPVLWTGDTTVVHRDQTPVLMGLIFHFRKKTISKNINVPEKYQLEISPM